MDLTKIGFGEIWKEFFGENNNGEMQIRVLSSLITVFELREREGLKAVKLSEIKEIINETYQKCVGE